MDYLQEIERIKRVMIRAGNNYVTRKLGQIKELGNLAVDDKVTASDLDISEELLATARERFPLSFSEESLKLEGEKAALDRAIKGHRWVFDPVDGTLELIARNAYLRRELPAVSGSEVKGGSGMIGGLLNEENQPVAMVGYVPETGLSVYSTLNEGPFVEIGGVRQSVAEPQDKIIGVQRTVVRLQRLQDFYEFFAEKEKKELEIIEGGGPGAMGPRMASQGINLYIDNIAGNWKEWDTIGVEVLTRRMGGSIFDLQGDSLRYNQEDPKRHQGMIASLVDHLGITPQRVLESVAVFAERYGHPLLIPDKIKEKSVYDHYKECMADARFFV